MEMEALPKSMYTNANLHINGHPKGLSEMVDASKNHAVDNITHTSGLRRIG